jgi:hypothetical protein
MCSDRLRKVAGSLQIDWKKGLLNTKHRKQHEIESPKTLRKQCVEFAEERWRQL